MKSENLDKLAEKIATNAHAGQDWRCGTVPFIEHPCADAGRLHDDDDADAKVVAWLHDVLEDTDETERSLLEAVSLPRFRGNETAS